MHPSGHLGVGGEPVSEGGKNRSDSTPERPQVAFSAVGHGYPHGPSTRAQCKAEGANSRYNPLGGRPSDFGRRKMRQPIVLDRQSDK